MDTNELNNILRKLSPSLGKKVISLWQARNLADCPLEIISFENLIRLIADNEVQLNYEEAVRLPPPRKEELTGELNIGEVIYPDTPFAKLGIDLDSLTKHMLIVGMTGTGKTNLAFVLLQELTKFKVPFLVFDWKGNYISLRKTPNLCNLRHIQVGSKNSGFFFNPLIPPPGTDPKHWMALLVDVIEHAYFVAHGVEYFFRRGIDHLYTQFGIYEGKDVYPTFRDLDSHFAKEYTKGREQLWMSSAKRVTASLTFSGLLGDVLNVRAQEPLEFLLDSPAVLVLDNLADIEKKFFVESLLLWIYHYRKNQKQKHGKLQHVILIEEAHHVLSEKKESESGEESIIESAIRMIREFGVGIIAIDQEPSKLSNSLLANTSTKVCFSLGNGLDIETITKAMSLSQEESRAIDQLKVGHAVVKTKQRFKEPIHVKFPLYCPSKNKDPDAEKNVSPDSKMKNGGL